LLRAFDTPAREVARLGALGQSGGKRGRRGTDVIGHRRSRRFIGSNSGAGLKRAGRTDIVVNDALGNADKWRKPWEAPARRLCRPAKSDPAGSDSAAQSTVDIHLSARPSAWRTTATDADAVLATNFRLSLSSWTGGRDDCTRLFMLPRRDLMRRELRSVREAFEPRRDRTDAC